MQNDNWRETGVNCADVLDRLGELKNFQEKNTLSLEQITTYRKGL